MEQTLIHKATEHISPVQVRQELQPLKNGARELEIALNDVRVINSHEKELYKVLRGAMLLVGIRAANLPVQEESQLLINFIYKKFGLLTISEIQLAFEKAVAGELEIDTANCFENFSCEYVGKILSAYKKWASQKFNENQMYIVPQTKNLLTMAADWKELCEIYYQDYLNGKFVITVMPYQLYDEFVKCSMMAEDVYEEYLSIAKQMLITRLMAERNEAAPREHTELSTKIAMIRSDNATELVQQFAKKLAVEFLYKTAKEKGFKNLFVKTKT